MPELRNVNGHRWSFMGMSTSLFGRDVANLLLLCATGPLCTQGMCAIASRLPRQPHRVEGIGGVAEPLEADGPTVPNGPNVRVLVLALHSASPASRSVGRQHDDLVAEIFDLAHLDPDVLERVVYRAHGVFVGGDSSACPRLDCAGWI